MHLINSITATYVDSSFSISLQNLFAVRNCIYLHRCNLAGAMCTK